MNIISLKFNPGSFSGIIVIRSIEKGLRFENLKSKCWHIATASPSRFYLNNLTPVKQRKMAMIKYKFPLSNGDRTLPAAHIAILKLDSC